jgi:O-succinylbenzoic acid--CoA ligase
MVPMQLYHSTNNLNKIVKLIVGGGVVSKELLDRIKNEKTQIFATYAMTETITHIAVKKLNNFQNEREQYYYKILPNIKISIDKRGCLVIDAPNVSENKIVTNDLVKLISATEFEWFGRFDTIINSGGVKLIPEQIEEKITQIISQNFFIAGIKDEILGEKLVLIVEGKKILNSTILNGIQQLKTLSKFEIPKKLYFVERFVKTPTQKINRKETLKLIKNIGL